MKIANFGNTQMINLLRFFFVGIIGVMLITGCGKSIEKQIPGTYISTDGQVIVLGSDNSVQYSDAENSDSSFGTWEIEDNKIIVHRETKDGTKRHDISAEIPKDKIESLYFQVVADSKGFGRFNSSIFTKKSE